MTEPSVATYAERYVAVLLGSAWAVYDRAHDEMVLEGYGKAHAEERCRLAAAALNAFEVDDDA